MARNERLPIGLTSEDRQWVDLRMFWLLSEFGESAMRDALVVLPNDDDFPFSSAVEDAATFGGEPDAPPATDPYAQMAVAFCRKICLQMQIDPNSVGLKVFSNGLPEEPSGGVEAVFGQTVQTENGFEIGVEQRQLRDPLALLAALAHQVASIHLIGHGRLSTQDLDYPLVSDLLTVFYGMGVVTANAAIREFHWQEGEESGWELHRHSELSMPMLGYALALFARIRDEDKPTWARRLRRDVRSTFKESQRFLGRSGVSEIPDALESSVFNQYAESYFARRRDQVRSGGRLALNRLVANIEMPSRNGATQSADETQSHADTPESGTMPVPEIPHAPGKPSENYDKYDKYENDEVDETLADEDYDPSRLESADTDGRSRCTYCGDATLDQESICRLCQESIQENTDDFQSESRRQDLTLWMLRWVALAFACIVALLAILASLGNR